jgi:3-hydroxyisobutyrate dehydrogenase
VASPLIGYKRDLILKGKYDPNFTVSQMAKDLDIVLSVGRSSHVPMPLTAQIREHYEGAIAAGSGDRDFFVLVKEMAARAGLEHPQG